MNLETEDLILNLTLLDADGMELDTAQLTIPAMGLMTQFLEAVDWATDSDKSNIRGILTATSSGRIAATVLQTRPLQLTTMPIVATP